jgi:hypothetical protein
MTDDEDELVDSLQWISEQRHQRVVELTKTLNRLASTGEAFFDNPKDDLAMTRFGASLKEARAILLKHRDW